MQWNFFIQRQVMDDMTLDIGYVAREVASKSATRHSTLPSARVRVPLIPVGFCLSSGDLDGGWNEFNGSYNGLQVKMLKRFSRGLRSI